MSAREPVLAGRREPGSAWGQKVPMYFQVEGGLHMIRGNHAPYFTLTYTAHRAGRPDQCWSGGAGHDEILKRYPRFADLAALHLADIEGAPMHAVENGWYWYSDYDGKGINLYSHQEPLYSQTPHERAAHALRVTPDELPRGLDKEQFAAFVETLRPRWKAEAVACIAHHNLRVFGDAWLA